MFNDSQSTFKAASYESEWNINDGLEEDMFMLFIYLLVWLIFLDYFSDLKK